MSKRKAAKQRFCEWALNSYYKLSPQYSKTGLMRSNNRWLFPVWIGKLFDFFIISRVNAIFYPKKPLLTCGVKTFIAMLAEEKGAQMR